MGGVLDWFGGAAMCCSLRTPADGSLHRSGIEATSRFDTRHSPPVIPTHSAFRVAIIAHCASIRHRKCLCLRLWLAIYGVAGAHTARSFAIGYRLADTRLTVTMQAQCSVVVCPATPNGSPAHTQCRQSSGRCITALCKPSALAALGGCRWGKHTRNPPLCSSHALLLTAH